MQLGLRNRIVQLGLRNLACATSRIAQLRLRNFQDCTTLLAQLVGLRNSACATLLAQLLLTDCATPRIVQVCLCNYAGRIAQLCNYTSSKQFQPPWNFKRLRRYRNSNPMELQTDLERLQVKIISNSHPHGTSN